MLWRFGLSESNVFAVLRLLPMGDRGKDVEILALWHQIGALERRLGTQGVRSPAVGRSDPRRGLFRSVGTFMVATFGRVRGSAVRVP